MVGAQQLSDAVFIGDPKRADIEVNGFAARAAYPDIGGEAPLIAQVGVHAPVGVVYADIGKVDGPVVLGQVGIAFEKGLGLVAEPNPGQDQASDPLELFFDAVLDDQVAGGVEDPLFIVPFGKGADVFHANTGGQGKALTKPDDLLCKGCIVVVGEAIIRFFYVFGLQEGEIRPVGGIGVALFSLGNPAVEPYAR